MTAALGALPIAAVLVAMAGLGWSAARAGAVGLALAVLLAATAFAFDAPGRAALGILAEAAHTSAVILWIVLPALMLHAYGQETGGVVRLRDALAGITDDARAQVILIAWFFGLFMEGAAGFGAPVALAAPLLVGLGIPPVRAVAAALLGHASGVSFGAIGTPALALGEVGGTDAAALALPMAALHAGLGWVLLGATVHVAVAGPMGAAGWRLCAVAGTAFLLPHAALAWAAGPELPTLGAALLGGLGFAAWLMRAGETAAPARGVLPDLAPYLAIVGLVLATRLIPPLRTTLSGWELGWTLPGGYAGAFAPLFHPGTILLVGLAGSAVATGRMAVLGPAARVGLARLAPVALALGVMILLARLMVHSGMVDALARAAAGLGPAWPVLAPSVGALGTFVTGSATASNVLFGPLQADAAAAAGLPATVMLAAQGYGAAVGNVVAPHNIVAGAAAVGLAAREGAILRHTALPALGVLAASGGLVLLAV